MLPHPTKEVRWDRHPNRPGRWPARTLPGWRRASLFPAGASGEPPLDLDTTLQRVEKGALQQVALLGVRARSARPEMPEEVEVFPDRPSRPRVVVVSRREPPVKMWDRIAERFVVELPRCKRAEHRLRDPRHLHEVSGTDRSWKLVQLGHTRPANEERRAPEPLGRVETHNSCRELCYGPRVFATVSCSVFGAEHAVLGGPTGDGLHESRLLGSTSRRKAGPWTSRRSVSVHPGGVTCRFA